MSQMASHPAAGAPEQDRLDYLTAVASIAWADRVLDPSESAKLEELRAMLGVPAEATERFAAATGAPDPEQISRIVARFRKDVLRVALLTDVLLMTFADGHVAAGEAEQIARFAGVLGLDTAQAVLIGRYVECVVQGQAEDALSRDLAGKLAALPGPVPPQSVIGSLAVRLRGRGK